MFYDGSIVGKEEATARITAYAEVRKRVAAVCRSEEVAAVLRKFDGKVINKRLNDAIKAAGKVANHDDGEHINYNKTILLGRSSQDYSNREFFNVFAWVNGERYNSDICRRGSVADMDAAYQPKTGERLDAEAAIKEFTLFADAIEADANAAMAALADYDKIAASARAIHDAIMKHNKAWDYSAVLMMGAYIRTM